MTTRKSRAAVAKKETASQTPAIVGGIVAVCVLALAGWWWLGRDDRLSTTLELQQKLLADELAGRQQRLAVDSIIRNVDTMDREQVQELRESLADAWKQIEQQSIDAFFAAPAAEKPALLDRDLERRELIRELRIALGNNSWGRRPKPKKDRKPEPAPEAQAGQPVTPEEKELAKLRRDLAKKYREALEQRAKERGLTLRM
jgi:hypothetical protein